MGVDSASRLRVIFLGTPQFAVPTLEALAAAHNVVAVLVQPDRPKGRGQQPAAPPVKEAALRLGLTVLQPERVRRPEAVEQLKEWNADVMIVVGYGQIIPQSIIDLPALGILNVHASLLPKYRGAAPIQWAVANGEQETGVTIMRIDAGLDTGDMLRTWRTAIAPEETALELGARLAVEGARLLVETLDDLRAGTATPVPQNHAEATYAPLLKKEDGLVDWRRSAQEICNRTRGFLPWPGAYSYFRSQRLHLWRTRVLAEPPAAPPGTLYAAGRRLFAACGGGSTLELLDLQLEGKKRVSAEAFLNGQRFTGPEILGVNNS